MITPSKTESQYWDVAVVSTYHTASSSGVVSSSTTKGERAPFGIEGHTEVVVRDAMEFRPIMYGYHDFWVAETSTCTIVEAVLGGVDDALRQWDSRVSIEDLRLTVCDDDHDRKGNVRNDKKESNSVVTERNNVSVCSSDASESA